MVFDIIQFGYTVCDDDWDVNEKSPLFNRIYYVIGGDATLECGKKTAKLNQSHLYIFPYMQPYRITQNQNNPLEVLWIHIHTKEFLLTDLLEIPIQKASIDDHFIQILTYFAQNSKLHQECKQAFQSWLSFLSIEQEFATRYPSGVHIDIISDFVDLHLCDGVTVQDISEYLNIDRSYFSRKFKAQYNISPATYLQSKRLHKASLLLLQGNSISYTAERTGYLDIKSFSRAFKQYMELSPAAYQRKYRLQP